MNISIYLSIYLYIYISIYIYIYNQTRYERDTPVGVGTKFHPRGIAAEISDFLPGGLGLGVWGSRLDSGLVPNPSRARSQRTARAMSTDYLLCTRSLAICELDISLVICVLDVSLVICVLDVSLVICVLYVSLAMCVLDVSLAICVLDISLVICVLDVSLVTCVLDVSLVISVLDAFLVIAGHGQNMSLSPVSLSNHL